jgi:spermidine synthase
MPVQSIARGALVFVVSGSVLVLEIVAARLAAPYVGLTLEMYSAIIGSVLAGISLGTWAGGRLADRVDPRRALGPLLVAGALLVVLMLPVARHVGDRILAHGSRGLKGVLLLTFVVPAAALSAVNPLVAKLELRDLERTGRVFGRLSALGSAGAIAGTFLTGFVLLRYFPTSHIIEGLGIALAAIGVLVFSMLGRRALLATPLLVLAVGGAAALAARNGPACDTETRYFCVNLDRVPGMPAARILRLDYLWHSEVDLGHPRYLAFYYTQRLGDVAATVAPPGTPIHALHIGGGGFTLPRYIAATRPRSTNLVLELDPGVVEVAERDLGLELGPRMRVETGDARTRLARLPDRAFDLVIGDAFGQLSVPWDLTTREAFREVRRALRPQGEYAMNIIDHPPLEFARAIGATLRAVFPHVAVIAPALDLNRAGGNFVFVAARSERPLARLARRMAAHGIRDLLLSGQGLDAFVGSAPVFTDDFAPADQLITR